MAGEARDGDRGGDRDPRREDTGAGTPSPAAQQSAGTGPGKRRSTVRRARYLCPPMNILVTNDDGILAPGLALLADVCREVGNVTVVAPDREQSGTSHSLTLHRPLRPTRRPDGGVADRRHADRLRHARDPGADAGAAGFRLLRREPRPQHGRGRALLGHRRRGDGGGDAGRSGHRHLVLPGISPRRWPPTATLLLRAGAADHAGVQDFPEQTLLNINLPTDPRLRGAKASR